MTGTGAQHDDSDDSALSTDDVNRLRLTVLRLSRNIRTHSIGDVTPSQVAVLSSLMRHGPSTIGQIAEYEHVQPPSASKIVAALEQRGLVDRAPDPADRRCTTISLTPAAEHYIDEVRAAATSWLAEQVATLDPDEAVHLRSALPALERLLRGAE
jgi:DNA-binding MarR family transcriptional regulator